MSDVNNGPGGDANSGLILAPRRLFGSDSNSGPIVASGVYLNLTRIIALPWAIPESERKVAKSEHKDLVTTIKRASDVLAANRSLLTDYFVTPPMTYEASPLRSKCFNLRPNDVILRSVYFEVT